MKRISIAFFTLITCTCVAAQANVSTNKRDADGCPIITAVNTSGKPYRLTIEYTHSGTTLGRRSSESNSITWGNFRPGETRDFQIKPGANCGTPNRLNIDDVKTAFY